MSLTVQLTWGELSVTVQRDNDSPDAMDDATNRAERLFLNVVTTMDDAGLLDELAEGETVTDGDPGED